MSSTFIATTPRASYDAMRFQGILITESHAQIASMLEKNLSREHALLFAEPVHEASGESTDWYTQAEGTPERLISMTPEAQAQAKARFAHLAGDIDQLANSLRQDPNQSKQIRGNILSLALKYPGVEHLYMVGSQPVITCWGFGPGTTGAQPEDMMRLGAAGAIASAAAEPSMPPPAAVSEKKTGFPWLRALLAFLLGLLLLVGLLFLLSLLFGPAGCAPDAVIPAGCSSQVQRAGCAPAPSQDPQLDPQLKSSLTAEQEKEKSLRRQLDDLRNELDKKAALCKPVPPLAQAPKTEPPLPVPPKPEEKPVPEEPKQDPEQAPEEPPSMEELMPLTPEAPPEPEPKPQPKPEQKPKPAPKPEQKPEPKPKEQKPKKGEELRIPKDAPKNNNMSFLEGCWSSETGLVNRRTGEPLDVQYCFDANGKGSRVVKQKRSNSRCAGSVRARFDSSGKLLIDADSAACSNGGNFVPHYVQCTPDNSGKAQCYGQERGGVSNRWKAKFRRQ